MKPAPFNYHAPATVDEVVTLLIEHGDEAKLLAGGQSLVPALALRLARFDHVIDLNAVGSLSGITGSNGHVEIGATTRQVEVERSTEVATSVPLLAKATPLIGHTAIRTRGTLGGSIAHADPASEYPAVALALDAEIHATGPSGDRTIPAKDFFESVWTTNLAPDELLTAVRFPVWTGRCGFAVEEVARRSGDFAIAGATAAVQLDGHGVVTRAAITMFGVGSTPVRSGEAESALLAGSIGAEVGAIAAAGLDPTTDVHASSASRKRLAAVVVRRAVDGALEEARNA